jgi:DHA2 family methylenomycin A resistance protein-like MFS transporter
MLADKKIYWTIVATCLAFVIIQLDVTIINIALPEISRQLGSTLSGLQWIIDAYTLALAVVLLTAGILADRWGSRRIFLTGFVVFGLASLACGLSPSTNVLVAARALQGLGGALVLPTSLALIAYACKGDDALRARAVSIWAASGAVATAAGPVLGGALVTAVGWRWIFYVNVPICLLAIFLTLKLVSETTRSHRGQFDFAGQFLITLGLLSLISSLIRIGGHGWSDPYVIGGIILFGLALAGFLAHQASTLHPLVPLGLFRILPFTSSVLSASLLSLTFYGLIFVLSLYFQRVLGFSPSKAGVAFLPLTAVIVVANLSSVPLIRKIGYRIAISGGLGVAALGYALLAALPQHVSFLFMTPGMMLITLGMGTAIPATTTVVIGSVDKNIAGTASAILNTGRQFSGALGVALFGTIVSDKADAIAANIGSVYLISALLLLLAMCKSLICIRKTIVSHPLKSASRQTA